MAARIEWAFQPQKMERNTVVGLDALTAKSTRFKLNNRDRGLESIDFRVLRDNMRGCDWAALCA
jgi:hypothetical protein